MARVAKRFPGVHASPPGFLVSRVLGSVSRVRVLGTLLAAGRPMSGREVARRARMPASTAAQALGELLDVGLVRRIGDRQRGRDALEPDHYLFAVVRAVFEAEARLPDAVAEFLSGHLSRTRGRGGPLALSFTGKGEMLALVCGQIPSDGGELRRQIRERFGLEFCGFVSDPAAGAGRFGVWQEFCDEREQEPPRADPDISRRATAGRTRGGLAGPKDSGESASRSG